VNLNNNTRNIIGGVLIVLVVGAAAGNFILMKNNNELEAELEKRNDEIKVLNSKLKGSTTEVDSWKKKYEASVDQCKTDTDNLQARIAAFAKQAAACDIIKRKLHIK
jgi:ElaB/YqjD/DUF883 family membrane-anchored ribosome-binding protein